MSDDWMSDDEMSDDWMRDDEMSDTARNATQSVWPSRTAAGASPPAMGDNGMSDDETAAPPSSVITQLSTAALLCRHCGPSRSVCAVGRCQYVLASLIYLASLIFWHQA